MNGYANVAERMENSFGSADDLGNVCVTDDIYRCISDSLRDTMRKSGLKSSGIDQVILCSSHFVQTFELRNVAFADVLRRNNIAPKNILGICGLGCTDVLRGIDIASTLIDANVAAHVLLVGIEFFGGDDFASRLKEYAVISDAAVTCIISARPGASQLSSTFRLISTGHHTVLDNVGNGNPISDAREYGKAITIALRSAGLPHGRFHKIFGSNIFRVFKKAREASAGVSEGQMYLDNSPRLGHCLACDPIINMIEYDGSGDPVHYVLFSEAEGHASAVLIRGLAHYG